MLLIPALAFDALVAKWIDSFLRVEKVGVWTPGWVKSKTDKLAPVASLVSVNHLRLRTELTGQVSV